MEFVRGRKEAAGRKDRKFCWVSPFSPLGRYRFFGLVANCAAMEPDALINDIQFDDVISLWIPDHADGIEAF